MEENPQSMYLTRVFVERMIHFTCKEENYLKAS